MKCAKLNLAETFAHHNNRTSKPAEGIKTNSSLVIGTKSDGTGCAVLFDPMYSDPRVIASGTTPAMLESLYGGKIIDREGKYITPSQIESDDVVYEVTDIWNQNAYVLIYSNSVSGEVTIY